jgi:small subunit ribosomal protein S16
MVKIRLTQTGSKNRKTYRIIAIDSHKRRDGEALEILGFYNPLVKPPQISAKTDRIAFWQEQGAQVSDTVKKLLHI